MGRFADWASHKADERALPAPLLHEAAWGPRLAAAPPPDDGDEDPVGWERRWRGMAGGARRPVVPGGGSLWEVVADAVFIRVAPSPSALTPGRRKRGTVVEAFDWDATCGWRRVLCLSTLLRGWMLLDHPDLGPLLRPLGRPLSARPPLPLAEAAREGAAEDVRRFLREGHAHTARDVDGKTPLRIAAEGGHLECCLLLLSAGADLAAGEAPPASAAAAAIAMAAGRDHDAAALDAALAELSEDAQIMADLLSEEALATRAAEQAARMAAQLPAPPPPAEALAPGGAGAAFLATRDAALHAEPAAAEVEEDPDAPMFLRCGEVVEVLGYDRMRQWARVEVRGRGGSLRGWVCLEHSDLGPPLQRVG